MKSDKDKKPQKPLSIEQAGNFLKEKTRLCGQMLRRKQLRTLSL